MNENEARKAQELDALISAGAGEAPGPENQLLDEDETRLASDLLALAAAADPDPAFLQELESKLQSQAVRQIQSSEIRRKTGWLELLRDLRQSVRRTHPAWIAAAALALALLAVFVLPMLERDHPALLPPLSALAGLEGSGLNVVDFPETEFILETNLPETADEVMVYLRDTPEPVTPERAADVAAGLGVEGEVYRQRLPEMEGSISGGDLSQDPFTFSTLEIYTVFSGPRTVNVSQRGATYEDSDADFSGESLPFEQALTKATNFLASHHLLPEKYRIEPDEGYVGRIHFIPLVDGMPVVNCPIDVVVSPDGIVSWVNLCFLDLEAGTLYPIISAQEMWNNLASGNAIGSSMSMSIQSAGEGNLSSRQRWTPDYRPGDKADLSGHVLVYEPVEGDGTPLLIHSGTRIRLLVEEDVLSSMAEHANLHAWGTLEYSQETGLGLRVEGWEVGGDAEFTNLQGTVQREGEKAILLADGGQRYILPNAPAHLMNGQQVSGYVRLTGRKEQGLPLLGWTALSWPPFEPGDPTGDALTPVLTELPAGASSLALGKVTPPMLKPGQQVSGLEGQLRIQQLHRNDGSIDQLALLAEAPLESRAGWEVYLTGEVVSEAAKLDHTWVKVWGTYAGTGIHRIQVERIEPVNPYESLCAFLGTVRTTEVNGNPLILFESQDGVSYVLASSFKVEEGKPLLDGALEGKEVLIEGVLRPEMSAGYRVIEDLVVRWGESVEAMNNLEGYELTYQPLGITLPEEYQDPLAGKAYVESVELVYYTANPNQGTAEEDPGLLYVQPMWVLKGRLESGSTFEIMLQAVVNRLIR